MSISCGGGIAPLVEECPSLSLFLNNDTSTGYVQYVTKSFICQGYIEVNADSNTVLQTVFRYDEHGYMYNKYQR